MSLALHLLRDLDVDFEELADAAVEADGFALVEVAFTVGVGNALLGASLDEAGGCVSRARDTVESGRGVPVVHVRDHVDFGLSGGNLLCRRGLGTATTEEERHCDLVGEG